MRDKFTEQSLDKWKEVKNSDRKTFFQITLRIQCNSSYSPKTILFMEFIKPNSDLGNISKRTWKRRKQGGPCPSLVLKSVAQLSLDIWGELVPGTPEHQNPHIVKSLIQNGNGPAVLCIQRADCISKESQRSVIRQARNKVYTGI